MVSQGLFFKKNPLYEKCPSCETLNSLRKSRPRKTLERLIKTLTIFAPYRCKKCGWRGYRARFVLTRQSLKDVLLYILLVIFAGFIVYQILKRFV
jgi:predicted RNA-binding Zn-ribbon protein involved in translation (DUF1610 family)